MIDGILKMYNDEIERLISEMRKMRNNDMWETYRILSIQLDQTMNLFNNTIKVINEESAK